MLEKEIENSCLDWLMARGIFAFKVKSVGTFDPGKRIFRKSNPRYKKGCPDILCCLSGQMIGLEIKTKTGRLSEDQKAFHKELIAAGGDAFVIRSIQDLERVMGA